MASTVEAQRLQEEMAQQVILRDQLPSSIATIAGVDTSHTPFDPRQLISGAVVLLSYPSLTPIETVSHTEKQTFPYVPGLLAFREVPSLLKAYGHLTTRPDLILVDGHGTAHPRRVGIASHLGVMLDLPTIGVAKSILVGRPIAPLGEEVGSAVSLEWRGEEIGVCLRTKKRCTPLIISPGHKISLSTAVQWVLRCLQRHRLPEPTRRAHQAANLARKSDAASP